MKSLLLPAVIAVFIVTKTYAASADPLRESETTTTPTPSLTQGAGLFEDLNNILEGIEGEVKKAEEVIVRVGDTASQAWQLPAKLDCMWLKITGQQCSNPPTSTPVTPQEDSLLP